MGINDLIDGMYEKIMDLEADLREATGDNERKEIQAKIDKLNRALDDIHKDDEW